MRNFFEDQYLDIELQREIINLISEISEYKGKLTAYQEQHPDIFNKLEKNIPLYYMKNFNSIYMDVEISSRRLKELNSNNILPKTIEEDAVWCYFQTLSLVQKDFHILPLTPETIQELHFQLIHYLTSDSAIWRKKIFHIPGTPENETYSSCHRPLPYELIPQYIKELCNQYNTLEINKNIHSLILIARFILNFYCIVPFDKGNGRLAFCLMHLLLLKNGYTFTKYVCLDKYIKKLSSKYYESIYKSSLNWYCNGHNISFWVKVFLKIILDAYKDLNCVILDSICKKTTSERIQNFILKQKETFTKDDIRNVYPDIADSTISKVLASLQFFGQIKLVSRGRNAQWIQVRS
ncbi:cell filamentation protein Fic [Bacillus thuringiensis]|uniref:Cell filamentation protein Fic n=1 Tax=Bacillus thuringiensis TaxID=1428 RepID=A0ABD6RZG2_BACTU|nr:Fic family protein [Bacillus thuringiensis]PER43999.1 cell filamentation protein Fic [Bacillus thuringiensis]PEU81316.1 cell filamentation protein Fic [Bacillus thuringiensis]PFI01641.1 cell filamentation protein Fic [Bacillus thuringiensis]PFW27169.1 cell filamentation protein Fic [Bacillus thuringiensis]PGY67564.1 cell filamentation protein Fic [Bacillus thuringiensis]